MRMSPWEIYVKESYDIVHRAMDELTINIDHQVEAYLVHLYANYMDKPFINTKPVCIKLLESTSEPVTKRIPLLEEVGNECLLVHSMEWGKARWPTETYYQEMGQTAYTTRAFIKNPPDMLYDDLAMEFSTATKILRRCRIN